MDKGWKNRSVGATEMNADSSRSHSIFTISIEMMSTGNGFNVGIKRSLFEHFRNSELNYQLSKLHFGYRYDWGSTYSKRKTKFG